jgi:hypothetical protein
MVPLSLYDKLLYLTFYFCKDNLDDALERGVDICKRIFEVKLTTYE